MKKESKSGREQMEGMSEDFWDMAENYAQVGYNRLELWIQEDPSTIPDKIWCVWFEHVERAPHADGLIHSTKTYNSSLAYCLDELSTFLREALRLRGFQELKKSRTYKQWRDLCNDARAILKAEGLSLLEGRSGDSPSDIAFSTLRHEYWKDVQNTKNSIYEDVLRGEIADSDELRERIESDSEIIYTSDAYKTIWVSDNEDAYEDQIGEKPETIEVQATWAYAEDVKEALSRDMDIDNLRKVTCPRCGEVPVWTASDEEEECHKCGRPIDEDEDEDEEAESDGET